MSVTVVNLHEALNNGAAPPHPASGPHETLWAEDWNTLRTAVSLGTSGISTLGIKIGTDGIETVGELPFLIAGSSFVRFRDGGNDEAPVGYISAGGELGMQRVRVTEKLYFGAGCELVQEGDIVATIPEVSSSEWHYTLNRGAGNVLDFDVQHDGTLEALHQLVGDYVANMAGKGMIFRHAAGDGLIRLRAKGDGSGLVIEDVVDYTARPVTFTNERDLMAGSGEFVDEVTSPLGSIAVVTASPSPLQYEIEVAASGVVSAMLDIGSGALQVNVDALMSGGGGIGVAAALTTPAEKALITTNAADIAALQAEIATTVKTLRTAGGQIINPDAGQIQLANSSSVIFDRPGAYTLRAVSSGGGGGGGGGVASFTVGNGLVNTGTAADPIVAIDLVVGGGLVFSGGNVTVAWAGSGGDFGSTTLPARSDHLHDATYSPLGHTHAGAATVSDITYENLDANGDIGTVANTVAAGNDSRFHTQHTDTGSTLDGVFTIDSARAVTAGSGQRGFGIERGASTNAVLVFDDADDTWKAGLLGSPVAMILEGDARLTDARTPTTHNHNGSEINAGTVAVAYLPLMVGDSGAGGTAGVVPAPAAGDAAALKFLMADGTWTTPAGSGNMSTGTYDPGVTGRVLKAEELDDGTDSITAAQGKAASDHVAVVVGNPHSVTAAQVGADPVGSAAAAQAASDPVGSAAAAQAASDPVGSASAALGTALAADIDEESFTGFATVIGLTEYLLGNPTGVTVRRAGTLNVGRLHADVDTGAGQIEVTVSNLTTPASVILTLAPGEQSVEELAMGITFLAGEKLDARITNIVGVPPTAQLMIELVRE